MSFISTASVILATPIPELFPFGPNDPTWLDNPAITKELLKATWQTLGMTFFATVFTVLLGLPVGLILVGTSKGGLFPHERINQVLALIVNVGRSIPFLIMVAFLIPFTRMVAGTALGWKAAIVPLVIGAVPFFARLVEINILGVEGGKIEAVKMMGASRSQIIWGVQVREAKSPLIQSITMLIITLISYSAITGAIGGDGLGALAIAYGYHRGQADTMLVSVVVIIIMVEIVQIVGDMLSRLVDHR